jgi:uncharacterized protein YbaP (TraB family)
MKLNWKSALAVGAFLVLSACATKPETAKAFAGPPEPALFAVRDADSTIYLFGTIHLRKAGAAWDGPASQKALAEADEVWTEIEMDDAKESQLQPSIVKLGLDPSTPLSSRLNSARAAQLEKAATDLGVPLPALNAMRPWLASITLTVLPLVKAGYDPKSGVDRSVVSAARAAGKPLRWFETAEQQLGFLAGLSEPVQLQMLNETLDDYAQGASVLAAMEAAWETGDVDGLMREMNTDMAAKYPELYDVILTRRNAAWVETISKEMDGAGVDFIAVGSGHLAGDNSVIAMLQKRGLRVERLTPVPAPVAMPKN